MSSRSIPYYTHEFGWPKSARFYVNEDGHRVSQVGGWPNRAKRRSFERHEMRVMMRELKKSGKVPQRLEHLIPMLKFMLSLRR